MATSTTGLIAGADSRKASAAAAGAPRSTSRRAIGTEPHSHPAERTGQGGDRDGSAGLLGSDRANRHGGTNAAIAALIVTPSTRNGTAWKRDGDEDRGPVRDRRPVEQATAGPAGRALRARPRAATARRRRGRARLGAVDVGAVTARLRANVTTTCSAIIATDRRLSGSRSLRPSGRGDGSHRSQVRLGGFGMATQILSNALVGRRRRAVVAAGAVSRRRWPPGRAARRPVGHHHRRSLAVRPGLGAVRTGASGKTTDVHLLAYNDFHGNLEPGGQNLYGQFAGGAAYLAKAVKDAAGPVRRRRGDDVRR